MTDESNRPRGVLIVDSIPARGEELEHEARRLGAEVYTATSQEQALAYLDQVPLDVAVLDDALGARDLRQRIKADAELQHIYVIVLVSEADACHLAPIVVKNLRRDLKRGLGISRKATQ